MRTRMMRAGLAAGAIAVVVACLAAVAAAERFADAIGREERRLLSALEHGRVVRARPFGANQNTGSLWKVELEHEGRRHTAIFKPRQWGDRDGWGRTPMEAAVYRLDRILGLDLVPPTVYRRDVDLPGHGRFAEGALVLWVDDLHALDRVPEHDWSPRREVFSSDLRILQALSRDADNQNGKNLGRGRHWLKDGYRVVKLDNEAAMRRGAHVELHHALPTWGPVRRFRRRTYERLKELRFDDLSADVGAYLSDDEIRDWLATRDRLVAHIEREAGRREVFFRPDEVAFDARARIGRPARRGELVAFRRRAARLGAEVEELAADDPRLDGAHARTVLTPTGVRVLLGPEPGALALVEELEHARQLQRLARRAGGHRALHRFFSEEVAAARLVGASMEARAKGRAAAAAPRGTMRRRVQAEQARHARARSADPAPLPGWALRALAPAPLGSRSPHRRAGQRAHSPVGTAGAGMPSASRHGMRHRTSRARSAGEPAKRGRLQR